MITETVPTVLTDEQVGDLYLDWYCFFKDNPGSAGLCIRAIEQAVLQSPEIQALRNDAERYRWVTTYEDNADELVAAVVSCGGDQSAINERVDAAIRALIPKQ